MSESGRLKADPLFQGLTRPPMVGGVSLMYFALNAIICLILFINTNNFIMILFVAPVMHGVGYILCLKEPRAIELGMLWFSKGWRCMNRKKHHNTNSYDIF